MAPTGFWIEGVEQASQDRGVDRQSAIVTFTPGEQRIFSDSPEFLIATKHDENN